MRITIKNKATGGNTLIFENSPQENAWYLVWDSDWERQRRELTELERRRHTFAKKSRDLFVQLVVHDGAACAQCGSTKNLTVDHVVPMAPGGSDDLTNLQILCKSCNSSKRDP